MLFVAAQVNDELVSNLAVGPLEQYCIACFHALRHVVRQVITTQDTLTALLVTTIEKLTKPEHYTIITLFYTIVFLPYYCYIVPRTITVC